MASENTRKELKALVGARTMQRGISGVVMNNLNQSMGPGLMNRNSPPTVPSGKPLNQADLEALGLSCELPQGMQTFKLNSLKKKKKKKKKRLSILLIQFFAFLLGNDGLLGRHHWDSPNMGESPGQAMPSSRVSFR